MLDIGSINKFFLNQKKYIDEKNGTLRLNFEGHRAGLENTNLIAWLASKSVTLDKIKLLRIDETTDKTANGPHADTVPGVMTILIPLEFQTNLVTITFKSFYYGHNKRGYKYRPKKEQYYHDEWLSNDDDFVTGINSKDFNQKLYQQYFGGLPILTTENPCFDAASVSIMFRPSKMTRLCMTDDSFSKSRFLYSSHSVAITTASASFAASRGSSK